MAKKSLVERNKKRMRMAKQFALRRASLKEVACDQQRSPEERFAARMKLARTAAQQLGDPRPAALRPDRAAARQLPQVRPVADCRAGAGFVRANPRHGQVELVEKERRRDVDD